MKKLLSIVWREKWNIAGAVLLLLAFVYAGGLEQWARGCFYLIMANMSFDISS